MRDFVFPEKIEVKKTKVNLTISLDFGMYSGRTQAVKDLMLKAVLIGASGNVLNQLIENRLDDKDWEVIKKAADEVNSIGYRLEKELDQSLESLEVPDSKHSFH